MPPRFQTAWLEGRRGVDHVHVLVGTALAAPADLFDLVTEKESGASQGSISKSRCEQTTVAFTSPHSFACLLFPCWQLVSCC
jgi:hypothetical protein